MSVGENKETLSECENGQVVSYFLEVFQSCKFLGLPDPDPFVRGTDPDSDSDPSIIKQKIVKKLRYLPVLFCLHIFDE
jgi:hypothetical protein